MTLQQFQAIQTRRRFFQSTAAGLGTIALANLLEAEGRTPIANPLAPKKPHFPAKAKRVVFLFMEGAPSQMDLFDPKPELQKWHGKPLPPSMTKDLKLAFIKPTASVLGSPFQFSPQGKCGMELSELLPHIGSTADDLCLIRSMHSEAFNHHPGQLFLFSGHMIGGRPSMGAWVNYGLGSESQNLPGFVVLASGAGTSAGSDNYTNGFLPSTYAGTVFRNSGDPILYLSNPDGVSNDSQRARLDLIRDVNQERYASTGDQEIASRMHSYELAYRMQMNAPELLDFSKEKPETIESYGINRKESKQFGTNCLLARRLLERGVRFVLLTQGSWDHHSAINKGIRTATSICDQPTAALIKDLKQRGMLEDTLLVWGGEFGRTPMSEIRRPEEADNAGRDHHPDGYSIFMTGAGVKGGQVIGKTDPLGLSILEDKVSVYDLQATMLHLLGMDHTRLTYRHMGRDFRLTDVHGELVKKILS